MAYDLMDEWERKLFGDQVRKWWVGMEIQKMGSIRDLPEAKPGQKIFDSEWNRELLGGQRDRDKDKEFAEAYGRVPDLFKPSHPKPATFGLALAEAMKTRPDSYTVHHEVVSNPNTLAGSITVPCDSRKDDSGNGTTATSVNVAIAFDDVTQVAQDSSSASGFFGRMDEPGDPAEFIQVGPDFIDRLKALQCHLTETSMHDDLGPDMINYDLLHNDGMKRVTGQVGFSDGTGKIILAVHTSLKPKPYEDVAHFIGHVPTGCLLHYPGFCNFDTALRVCEQLGHLFREYICTREPRRLLSLFQTGAAMRWFQHVLETNEFIEWARWYHENER